MDDLLENISLLRIEEIKILDYVVKICEENNIQYYLDFGTLLGAIRHDGFIPWDDDIDISMPRKDYEKFVMICKNLQSSEYFLQTYESDKEYYQSFAKMRNIKTTFIEESSQYLHFNKGIYIDIFPVESIPKKNLLGYLKISIAIIINKTCVLTKNPYAFMPYKYARIVQRFFKPIKIKTYNQLIERLTENKKESNYMYVLDNGFNFKAIVSKKLLDEKCTHKFEKKSYKIPKRYDEYLRTIYGDYMQLPPENQRCFPHKTIAIDINKGDTESI